MTISRRLNIGRPAPPGRGSAAGQKFLASPYYNVYISERFFSLRLCLFLCRTHSEPGSLLPDEYSCSAEDNLSDKGKNGSFL